MDERFSLDEIDQIVKVARITAPGFTSEQYQDLVQSQEELSKTGFCEASWAVVQLQQEKDIYYDEVIQAIENLLKQKSELEGAVHKLAEERAQLQAANRQAVEMFKQAKAEVQEIRKNLKKLQLQRQDAEEGLNTFREEADKEKERLNLELEECRVQAGVTHTEIETARDLKVELQKQGFGLDLALHLCAEFGKYENYRDKLIEALQKHGSLQKYIVSLREWGESQKKTYEFQIRGLEGNYYKLEGALSQQQAKYTQGEMILQQQNQQVNAKADILNFYQHYQPLRALIDYLGKFEAVGFYHCSWCGARYWILNSGNTTRNQTCLWCSVPMAGWDTQAYQAINRPPGTYKLLP